MSGPKKDITKLSEQGVVTEAALLAYLQNKLSPEEKQQLEKLLQEDPFAQDALEGLQSSLNQTAVVTSISSLNKKVRERSGLKERKGLKIHWVNYAWAAVVFGLLIGIGFIMVNFLNKKDNNLALNEKKESTVAPVVTPVDTTSVSKNPGTAYTDTAVAKQRPADTVALGLTTSQNKPNEQQKSVAAGTATLSNNITGKDVANKTTQASTGQTITASAALQKPAAIDANQTKNTFSKSKLSADSIKTNGYAYSVSSADKNARQEAKDPSALQDDAMKAFNSGDYNTAADDFDRILKHESDNADALYFGGISDYINGKIAKSENNFDKLLKKGNKYTEGSKWYKANILIKKGHSEAAKPLLQDLSNSNGSYKERAIKKLAEMGF